MSNNTLSLSDAKTRLSEVIRRVRSSGEPLIITVDGEPAAQIGPVCGEARQLTPGEVAIDEALHQAILRLMATETPFDAVEAIRDGRR